MSVCFRSPVGCIDGWSFAFIASSQTVISPVKTFVQKNCFIIIVEIGSCGFKIRTYYPNYQLYRRQIFSPVFHLLKKALKICNLRMLLNHAFKIFV